MEDTGRTYDNGETSHRTSKVTGIDMKIVSTYFKEFEESFSETLGESTETDFLDRMVVSKELTLYRLETYIENLEKERLEIENLIELEPNRPIWYDRIMKIICMEAKIELAKFQLQANPRFSPWFYRNNNHTNWTVGLWPQRITI